eukprot:TRINITY_DN57656_c0_g1_i1.p1 TRINITY_DN57656_c0_g1~~TRINITY_DN57656_c0_g1_i1.p1  ORF type:complete len:711 (-),score=112.95 TRINITY_DN57656_c0_g1_i1:292-2424(-)
MLRASMEDIAAALAENIGPLMPLGGGTVAVTAATLGSDDDVFGDEFGVRGGVVRRPVFVLALRGSMIMGSVEQMVHAAVERLIEERMGSAPPPARASIREALPNVVVTKEDLLDTINSRCSVCLEEYQAGARATRMLCGHLFCTQCIFEWLRIANSCPVCRFELATDSRDYEATRTWRSRGQTARLKEGELRTMRICDMKRLMGALGVSAEGCVEKQDLIQQLRSSQGVQLVFDREDVRYEEHELQRLEMPFLRNLMERHAIPSVSGVNEQQERELALEQFAIAGWVGKCATTPLPPAFGDASAVDDSESRAACSGIDVNPLSANTATASDSYHGCSHGVDAVGVAGGHLGFSSPVPSSADAVSSSSTRAVGGEGLADRGNFARNMAAPLRSVAAVGGYSSVRTTRDVGGPRSPTSSSPANAFGSGLGSPHTAKSASLSFSTSWPSSSTSTGPSASARFRRTGAARPLPPPPPPPPVQSIARPAPIRSLPSRSSASTASASAAPSRSIANGISGGSGAGPAALGVSRRNGPRRVGGMSSGAFASVPSSPVGHFPGDGGTRAVLAGTAAPVRVRSRTPGRSFGGGAATSGAAVPVRRQAVPPTPRQNVADAAPPSVRSRHRPPAVFTCGHGNFDGGSSHRIHGNGVGLSGRGAFNPPPRQPTPAISPGGAISPTAVDQNDQFANGWRVRAFAPVRLGAPLRSRPTPNASAP